MIWVRVLEQLGSGVRGWPRCFNSPHLDW
jgi:hypothetical protein